MAALSFASDRFSCEFHFQTIFQMGKINVYDNVMIENQKKRENMEIKELLHVKVL